MTESAPDQVNLSRQNTESLAKFLREFEKFLDNCDEDVCEAMADHFGFSPAAESISAALSLHADTLEAALDTTAFTTTRTPT
ncbi:hypothetical protein ACFRJ1_26735 [Streptomyces sp. NPDC056773]|uniref:hypothetical protein n=1 Tax=unclassified Streptomyces TaxID=2593676 RepID=UPI0036C9DFD9